MWILLTLYMAAPVFVANMLPVLATRMRWLPSLAYPVWEKRLGTNKLWRGFLVGTLGGGAVALVQWFVYAPYFSDIGHAVAFGLLAGLGALVGDALESAVKRYIGIQSGQPFIPFDYIDYIVGFLLFTYLIMAWTLPQILVLFLFAALSNPLVNGVAYLAGVKNTYW